MCVCGWTMRRLEYVSAVTGYRTWIHGRIVKLESKQSLTNLDAENYAHDPRVDSDVASPNFSYSLKQEGFFVIGLHPGSSRVARQFKYPAIIFNPHAEFEKLRKNGRYEQMKLTVRKRDVELSGSVNPMLKDFGEHSEVFQYTGRRQDPQWQCPLRMGGDRPLP